MNYFAHGCRFINDPYFLAGTAVPDWLGVADRQSRVRSRQAALFIDDADPCVAAVARGIVQHHHDDGWFHGTDAFAELSWKLSDACRAALPADEGFRPSFLGHILVELLLDWELAAAEPERLHRYYAVMETVDPHAVERAVNRMAPRPAERLVWFIERFCQTRFLWDYADDGKLLYRLNQVLSRVQLAPLPESFLAVIGPARKLVAAQVGDLLPGDILKTQSAKNEGQRTNPPCSTE